ncbi:MAG TPA: hypothetical protein VFS00_31695 [Polyangiaceae bacterium]|nr:hypothetical protein [Polyangiaceae bacterium]
MTPTLQPWRRGRLADFGRRLKRRWAALAPDRRRALAAAAAVLAAALGAGAWARGRRAGLVVVNAGGERAWLSVDGGPSVELPPSSVETPRAGVELALPPGEHRFVVRVAGGAKLDERRVTLAPQARYLYAPVDADQCFWVQTTAYGQVDAPDAPARLLPREQRIWPLPPLVDAWFVPNPPPNPDDDWSTGGVRVAVRQVRCGFPP